MLLLHQATRPITRQYLGEPKPWPWWVQLLVLAVVLGLLATVDRWWPWLMERARRLKRKVWNR